ncbi:MAG TPA: hypothetical protein VKR56_00285 [Candidatus Cybelea sp.]|nr:hypothetical protein [Candidatus Cybelea sp.]
MSITAKDLQDAQRTVRDAQTLRASLEQALINAGAWEADVVDRVMSDHAETLSMEDGKVAGVEAAVASYRRKNPDGFVPLGRIASNPRLPAMQRFAAAYKDVLKARDRKQSSRATKRAF